MRILLDGVQVFLFLVEILTTKKVMMCKFTIDATYIVSCFLARNNDKIFFICGLISLSVLHEVFF